MFVAHDSLALTGQRLPDIVAEDPPALGAQPV
jgi:hypothetical protein